ncbi:MAG TPA: glycosyltransferase family 2 protein [Aquabacterium sp.]|uniref:glycosyltransferase family 2 protein n=1 Tax=Aquabacterium sp. TaxID=1872578 RepID=UPI002E345456|nr:glycosyltransferase family 2 protein [Aquabacterium sp.]HEX5371235.1 glycosyltransferase family 2 protein [Aquabacterium sp.]
MSGVRTVSVIVPCRNERDHIEAFCRSVVEQSVPAGWALEVLIADGMSDDGTRERLAAWCAADPRFVMIDNPGRIVSCGLNRCIERARGDFIVRLDVHSVYARDYIAQCLSTWQATGADNVGGPWKAEGQAGPSGTVQRAIAAAFQSRWVAGGALSRDLAYSGPVDTVYLGAWPRETFQRFGGFDEQLVRNQDDEHNLRIHQGGGRVWQASAIRSTYHPRASIGDVFRQYRQYGYWKPFVMKKHGQAASLRHLIPGLFVGVWLGLLVWVVLCGLGTSLLGQPGGVLQQGLAWATVIGAALLLAQTVLYGAAVAAVSLLIARQQGMDLLSHLPRVIAAYHVGYGLGSLRGWWDVVRTGQPDPAFGRLTRGAAHQR